MSQTWNLNSEWARGITPRRAILIEICERLDDVEIEQISFSSEECPRCFTLKMGILDEGKLRQPLPRCLGGKGLTEFYFQREKERSFYMPGSFPGIVVDYSMNDYEICQSIVMTGLFTREQLGLSKLTNHELEICERRFAEVRPLRCDCDFGSPTEEEFHDFTRGEGEYYDPVPVNGLTAVEKSFVSGKPVRTGYRRRSLDSVRRRRKSYALRKKGRSVRTYNCKPVPGFALQDVSSSSVELKFKYMPYGMKSRPYRKVASLVHSKRREIIVKKLHKQTSYFVTPFLVSPRKQVPLPDPNHKKYWYFLRRNGYYTHSLHHPYGGELSREAEIVLNDFPT